MASPRALELFTREGGGADFEEVVAVQDAASGLRALIAIHSTALGPAFGGVRRMTYATEGAALDDALRLASAMTLKCALADLPAGGAKTVILDHPKFARAAGYRALGEVVARLGGRYVCGPDVGTTDADLDAMRAVTTHVNPAGNDAGASTALGVLAGIRGTLRVLDGSPDFAPRSFLVQGLGAVGSAIASALKDAGADVTACDLSPDAVARARARGIRIVDPADALATPCDVFVPCALGGILTADAVANAPFRAVCGSANNQLATPTEGDALAARGILAAPDFLVNAGAVIEGVITTRDGTGEAARARASAHIARIEETTVRVLERARRDGDSAARVAEALARERLDAPRAA